MRNILIVVIMSQFFVGSAYAANEEETACFKILKSKTNSLYGVNIASVWNGSTIDISTYTKFQGKKYRPGANPTGYFNSQRNNIGTIILPGNYITTQYVPFGNTTNFKFPINNVGSYIGAPFTNFKNQMVYAHHAIPTGEFLSCGYLKITPLGGYNLASDLDPANYFTNILDGGGFEIDDSLTRDVFATLDGHFIVGKSRVIGTTKLGSGSGTTLEKLFRIDIVNVIYDNKSSYFNEYETFPLQVDAMTSADAFSTAWSVQQDFAGRVMSQTCLSAVHPTTASLPVFCAGSYASTSNSTRATRSFALIDQRSVGDIIREFLIPTASARLSDEDLEMVMQDEPATQSSTGNVIMMDQNFDYFEYQKIKSFPSESLTNYILLATNYSYDQDLQERASSGTGEMSEYDTVLLGCNIPYDKRVSLIKEWLASVDMKKFSMDTIVYPDPKIGDCVIPFPDKRNAYKIIPGSFLSNQKYARYIMNLQREVGDPRVATLRQELRDIEGAYALEIEKGNTMIASGEVPKGQKILRDAATLYEPKIRDIQQRMSRILNPNMVIEEDSTISIFKKYLPNILVGVGLLLLTLVIVGFRRNQKPTLQ